MDIFPATYCKRQEAFKIKLADSAGVCPKGHHIPSRMSWPSWKEQIVWRTCSWLSAFPFCPGGGGDSHSDMSPPPHVDQIRWLVRACEGLQASCQLGAMLNTLQESAFNLHEEYLIVTDRWESWDVSSPACYGSSWRAKDPVSWHVYKPPHHTRIQHVYKPLHQALKGKVCIQRQFRKSSLWERFICKLFPQREHFLCSRISLNYLQAIAKSSQVPP